MSCIQATPARMSRKWSVSRSVSGGSSSRIPPTFVLLTCTAQATQLARSVRLTLPHRSELQEIEEKSSLKGGEDINEKSRLSTGPQSSCLLFGHGDSKVPGNLVQPPRIQKLVDRIVRIIGIVREILVGN